MMYEAWYYNTHGNAFKLGTFVLTSKYYVQWTEKIHLQ